MSNSVMLTEQQQKWLTDKGIDEAVWTTLQNSIYPGAKPESVMMAIQYCKARSLDVLKRPCHIVPMPVKNPQTKRDEWRDVIMPGIYEIRTTACKTGEYAGQDDPEFGPMVEIDFGGQTHTAPEYCKVTVWRLVQGQRVSFSHTEYFEEAAATKKGGVLNSMWTKRKRGQLAKCAEAGALRKAFPDELGGVTTAEEMEGRDITPQAEEAVFVELATQEQVFMLEEKIGDDSDLQDIILTGFNVKSLSDIEAKQVDTVVSKIEKYKEAAGENS